MSKEAVETPKAEVAVPDSVPSAIEPPVNTPSAALVEADLLVEDVSIDGMCGVY
jgi:mycofactocin precursor